MTEPKNTASPKSFPVVSDPRSINVVEMASLIDAVESPVLFRFCVIAICTLARTREVERLHRIDYDCEKKTLHFRRRSSSLPRTPVIPTLQPWLDKPLAPYAHYLTETLGPPHDLNRVWRETICRSGLEGRVTPQSIRQGMARELRERGSGLGEISLILGHRPLGDHETPPSTWDLSSIFMGIEDIVRDIRGHLKIAKLAP